MSSTHVPALTPAKAMELMAQLDELVHVGYSRYTNKWFASLDVEIGGDGVLQGVVQHRESSDEAVLALFNELTSVQAPKYLVTNAADRERRKHWRWDGAAFIVVQEETRQHWDVEVTVRATIRVDKIVPVNAERAIEFAKREVIDLITPASVPESVEVFSAYVEREKHRG